MLRPGEDVERIADLRVGGNLVEVAAAVAGAHEVEAQRIDPGFLQRAGRQHKQPARFHLRAGEPVAKNDQAFARRAMQDGGEMRVLRAEGEGRFGKRRH